MKSYGSFLFAVAAVILASCGGNVGERPDGWYLLSDGKLSEHPIVTTDDFDDVELEVFPSEHGDVCQIVGRLKADKASLWADATEAAAGEMMAFVFDGEVLAAPRINCRIESGAFAISQRSEKGSREKLEKVYSELSERIGKTKTVGKTDDEPLGAYVGTIPAADCPGIVVTLVLNANGTYTMNMDYMDRDGDFDEQGAYESQGDRLLLTSEHGETSLFRIEDGRLRMLDGDGNEVAGALADMYLLYRR